MLPKLGATQRHAILITHVLDEHGKYTDTQIHKCILSIQSSNDLQKPNKVHVIRFWLICQMIPNRRPSLGTHTRRSSCRLEVILALSHLLHRFNHTSHCVNTRCVTHAGGLVLSSLKSRGQVLEREPCSSRACI